MDTIQQTFKHSVWECKYHIVWIPKYRRKTLYGELRKYLGEIFHELAKQKERKIEEGHLMSDHVYMTKIYGCEKFDLLEDLKKIIALRGVVGNKVLLIEVLNIMQNKNIDFVD